MGIGFAGTYMPGLRMVSERFPSTERGRAVGIYVGAFTLGAAISLFLTGMINSLFSWRWAFFITSLGPIAGGMIALFKLGEVVRTKAEEETRIPLTEVLRNRPALMMIGGYVAHMWEMFGMRGWMVAFLTACLLTAHYDLEKAVSLSAVIAGTVTLAGALSNALGGTPLRSIRKGQYDHRRDAWKRIPFPADRMDDRLSHCPDHTAFASLRVYGDGRVFRSFNRSDRTGPDPEDWGGPWLCNPSWDGQRPHSHPLSSDMYWISPIQQTR